jgi:hypothetical protein
MKNNFKTNLKAMKPYIIFNAIVFAIIGGFIGKNIVEIHNTSKRIDNDSRALKKFMQDMAKSCPNTMTLDELEKMGDGDDRKPIEPIPIYVYD